MFLQKLQQHLPPSWKYTDTDDYKQVFLPKNSSLYNKLELSMLGIYGNNIRCITQVENPYLYGQFLLKKAEYETRGDVKILELFHATGAHKVDSILSKNLDWRMARRVKFGVGVSFSPYAEYAHREASWTCGNDRAMIVADVLVGSEDEVSCSPVLPRTDFDTTVGNRRHVYVKFYDNEFYPKYVIYYNNQGVKRKHISDDYTIPKWQCLLS